MYGTRSDSSATYLAGGTDKWGEVRGRRKFLGGDSNRWRPLGMDKFSLRVQGCRLQKVREGGR